MMESPFRLAQDVEASFSACPTLRAVREHLSMTLDASFCGDHEDLPSELVSTYLLHRDVLHALIVPVIALYSRTANLASAALCSSRPSDLELAYREDARSAFLFMQCFVHENEAWCYSRSCPACIVHDTLSDEAPLRLAVTAALMAERAEPASSSTAEEDIEQPAPLGRFLDALHEAVINDPFWGPRNWSHILAKANALHGGLRDLISQASELESLVSSTPCGLSSPAISPGAATSSIRTEILASPTRPSTPGPQYKSFPATEAEFKRAIAKLSRCASSPLVSSASSAEQSLPNLRPSPLAKQQLRMDREQRALMHRQAWQIHSAVSMPAAERLAMRRGRRRYRDEDLWEVEGQRSRSMTT